MKKNENKNYGRAAVMALIAVFFGGIALLWSWNTVAVDLFALPIMEFRHAVAAEMMLIAVGALVGLPGMLKHNKHGAGDVA